MSNHRRGKSVLLAITSTVFFAPTFAEAQVFWEIPFWTETGRLGALSGDGSVAVGTDIPFDTPNGSPARAWRWSASAGKVYLEGLPGYGSNSANGISHDGSVIVGTDSVPGAGFSATGFRWTQSTGIVALAPVPGHANTGARAVSADGGTVVGWASEFDDSVAVRWSSSGEAQLLPPLPGQMNSYASGVSEDGSIVVGASSGVATRWTTAGVESLGSLPGYSESSAAAVSWDGSVIVGQSRSGTYSGEPQAFRWTSQTGMEALSGLPGVTKSEATSVSADGSMIVGTTNLGGFIWTEATGMLLLKDYLLSRGLPMEDWYDLRVDSVSADGSAVGGSARYFPGGFSWHSSAFVVTGLTVPGPGALAALGFGFVLLSRRQRVAHGRLDQWSGARSLEEPTRR